MDLCKRYNLRTLWANSVQVVLALVLMQIVKSLTRRMNSLKMIRNKPKEVTDSHNSSQTSSTKSFTEKKREVLLKKLMN